MSAKHPNITNISAIEPRVENRGKNFGFRGRRLGAQVGAKAIGSSYIEVDPGKQAFPNHFHTSNEEAVFVIEGKGHVRIGKEEIEITTGDYIAFPVVPDHAHSIRNTSQLVLKLLCISTLHNVEVVGYPDSKKMGIFAMPDASKGLVGGSSPWVRMMITDQPSVDYYEGEQVDS
ncbi:MAG: cupin domain-containing protein [Bdellovibrionaceae bacterium]|nr:cupin domain-containing protein [Pseudobdellovibrionaceae bacterium]